MWFCPNAQQDTIIRYWAGNVETNVLSVALTRAAYFQKEGVWMVESRYFPSGKLYMTGSYREKEFKTRQGDFKWYHENGKRSSEVTYINNKEEGLWKSWHENGRIKDSLTYKEGRLVKTGRQWNNQGNIIQYYDLDESGSGKARLYRDKDSLFAEGAYSNGSKNGKWISYSPSNQKEWELEYQMDSISDVKCFDESGREMKNCIWEQEAQPDGGREGWKRYLIKVLTMANYPSRKLLQNENNLDGTVWVRFVVQKDGSLGEIQIIKSLNKEADQIVKDAMLKSPRWSPAIQKNKTVGSYFTQPLTFRVTD